MGNEICTDNCNCLSEIMCKYIGQTVTVFTRSGGMAGCGFTGVLAYVNCNCIALINRIGEAPACPVGSNCCSGYGNGFGFNNLFNGNNCGCNCGCNSKCRNNNEDRFYGNPLGAITEIPVCVTKRHH